MSTTENILLVGLKSFNKVCGSGTVGALGITALLTACKSCTILHPEEGGDFLTGKRGVLHGESKQGIITPAFKRSLDLCLPLRLVSMGIVSDVSKGGFGCYLN